MSKIPLGLSNDRPEGRDLYGHKESYINALVLIAQLKGENQQAIQATLGNSIVDNALNTEQ